MKPDELDDHPGLNTYADLAKAPEHIRELRAELAATRQLFIEAINEHEQNHHPEPGV